MKRLIFLLLFFVSTNYAQNKSWTFFSQEVNVENHIHKKFIVSADVKVRALAPEANAQLFINIYSANNKGLHYGRMYDAPITKNSWNSYKLEGVIKDSASFIHFGAMALKAGFFYFDNFSVKVQETDGSWTTLPVKNAGFEDSVIENEVPSWKDDQENKNFSYHSSKIASNENKSSLSLLIKSEFDPAEIPVEVKSVKLNPSAEAVLIENINLIDVVTGKHTVQSVLIRDQKIARIKKKITVKDAAVVKIDGTGKWLLPGLIDSHVHLFQSGSLYTRPDVFDLTKFRSYEDERKWLRVNAPDLLKRYLQSGITTIIDLGGPLYNFKIRDLYSNNTAFPNIYLTGPLISTYQPKAFEIKDSPIIKANTVEEAVNLVRAQLPYKPDFIKIWYINRGDTALNYEIVKATIAESHKHNLKVAVHATQLKTAKRAIEAKADILVHSVREPIDDEFVKMITAADVSYIPTLMVSDKYTEAFTQEIAFSNTELRLSNPFPIKSFSDYKHLNNDAQFEKNKKYNIAYKEHQAKDNKVEAENLKLLQQQKVNIATGTDAGNIGTLHATSYQEEVELMKASGLSNLEVIQASTINAAKVLGKQDEIGSIEVSKLADLIILDSNPLEDLQALQKISHVVKGGSIYRTEDIIKETPENIVQRQVNAYNLRNTEAFLENFSDDIEIYNFPDKLQTKGIEAYRKRWESFFTKYPDLHCEIVNRTVNGNTVIDHERVKFAEGDYSEVIVIYKIENEKIAKVYFVRD